MNSTDFWYFSEMDCCSCLFHFHTISQEVSIKFVTQNCDFQPALVLALYGVFIYLIQYMSDTPLSTKRDTLHIWPLKEFGWVSKKKIWPISQGWNLFTRETDEYFRILADNYFKKLPLCWWNCSEIFHTFFETFSRCLQK